MRRWNGWGEESISLPLKPEALAFLAERVGPGTPVTDATLAATLAQIPASRLPTHPDVSIDPEARLRASFGQSCSDWLRLRHGEIDRVCDGVAYPETSNQVRELLAWANQQGAIVIPYGGGTSVVGHLTPPAGDRPVLCIHLSRLNKLMALDREAQLATFGAGVAGPDLEAQLRAQGYMLGHFPQSFEYATLGGWVVTRSSGQQSLRYGRIEQLFAGGRLETPTGTLELPTFPASAAGPALSDMVLGSEGRLGVLTEATVRVTPLPDYERFHAVFFPSWEAGRAAVQAIAQAKLPLSMLRLSNPVETMTTLTLAGHSAALAWLQRYLAWRGVGEGKCILLMGITGNRAMAAQTRKQALTLCCRHGGLHGGTTIGEKWKANRFKGVYMRNALWEHGYVVDTMETAADWAKVTPLMRAMEAAGQEALAGFGEKAHAYTHLSHVYAQGSSVYTTFIFRAAPTFAENHARWRALKAAVSHAIVEGGGTISHQHGVGKDHAPYLKAEKGERGMTALESMIREFDPNGVMRSGNLIPDVGA
ncbi:MAG: FAD-binding oxidoreductase [Burkholderiales bacterium]|nr:FAD-binding oxidoreductase [Burkholderiales bacterium]